MRTGLLIALGIIIGSILSTTIAAAWTAPTANPPGGNVASPVNVGNVMQLKNGTLGVNGLGVFGDTILSGSGTDGTPPAYLNFGATSGDSGYGIRNNNGTLEFKNNSGSWGSFNVTLTNLMQVNGITANGLGQITSIKFGDGTTQTTAAIANPWGSNGSSIYYNGGNVGIGTTNPTQPLDVRGAIRTANTDFVPTSGNDPRANLLNWSLTNSTTAVDTRAASAGIRYLSMNCGAGVNGTCDPSGTHAIYQDLPISLFTNNATCGYGISVRTESATGTIRVVFQEIDANHKVL